MLSLRSCVATVAFTTVVAASVAACSSSEPQTSEPGVVSPSRPVETNPTFTGTIAWILQDRCQRCHSEGGIAPFPLVSYEEVKGLASLAAEKMATREMPPWGAFDDETCKVNHKWKDDLRATPEEIEAFAKWVAAGKPYGNEADRPSPKTFPPSGLPSKTHTIGMKAPHEVMAGGKDDIRCFPVDPGFAEDTWVSGTNVAPGNPRIVHHVIVYSDPNREGVVKAGAAGSYPCFGGPEVSNPNLVLAWAPGVPPNVLPEDTGLKIAKSSHLIVQVHYHPAQTTQSDQTQFELRVMQGKPSWVAQVILAGNAEGPDGIIKLLPGPADPPSGPEFKIPANAPAHTETMEVVVPDNIGGFPFPQASLIATGAHMHWAGVDMKIEIERKTATADQPAKECLLGTPKYDFNWQRAYAYDAPMEKLPAIGAGDKIRFSCKYDNTTNNRHVRKALAEMQQAAPTDISLGEQTLDEMCLGVLVAVRRASLID
ncbi:MAG: hypothetical protein KF819_03325 [Labilithrix sp.]|nr:hypothetical protein [Labilithrix sp.]